MKLIKEFKLFALRGNVLDLAVAVVIGAAFGRIVSSLVNDVIMPPLGLLLSGVDFRELSFTLKETTNEASAVTINYGLFIQHVVDFVIVAFVIFIVIRLFEKAKKKEQEKPVEPAVIPPQEKLLTEIRDLLKKDRA